MSWDYSVTAKAQKELKKLGHVPAAKIFKFLDERICGDESPRRFGKSLQGELGEFWRYRVEDYRILCQIQDDEVVVLVVKAGHRRDVYES